MSIDIYKYPWNDHHNPGNKHNHHPQKFPSAPLSYFGGFLVMRTHNMRFTLLAKFLYVQYSIGNYRHWIVKHISRTYTFCVTETSYPLKTTPHFSPAPNHHQFALLYEPILSTSCKWNYAPFVFLWLASFIKTSSGFIHAVTYGGICFFLKTE